MAYSKLTNYRRSPSPQLPGDERRYIDDELRKLETLLAAIIKAIEELRAKVP